MHPVHVSIIGKPKHHSSPFISLVTAQHEDGSWNQKADGFCDRLDALLSFQSQPPECPPSLTQHATLSVQRQMDSL